MNNSAKAMSDRNGTMVASGKTGGRTSGISVSIVLVLVLGYCTATGVLGHTHYDNFLIGANHRVSNMDGLVMPGRGKTLPVNDGLGHSVN